MTFRWVTVGDILFHDRHISNMYIMKIYNSYPFTDIYILIWICCEHSTNYHISLYRKRAQTIGLFQEFVEVPLGDLQE